MLLGSEAEAEASWCSLAASVDSLSLWMADCMSSLLSRAILSSDVHTLA